LKIKGILRLLWEIEKKWRSMKNKGYLKNGLERVLLLVKVRNGSKKEK
jgi:hypothetical protein